jgi:succinoglycan biosynthesis protein ExoM
MRVDICIATYRRPELLRRLLADLAAQELPVGVSTHIIVVDNDVQESARAVVAAFLASGASGGYFTQPVQNIALTRNCALDHSRGDLIAFIDDDESAPTGWLSALLTTMEQYSADVVLGPVNGVLPASAPKWIVNGRFFERPARPSGSRMDGTAGGCGNALVSARLIRGRFAFDPSLGLSGGEDSDFFRRIWRSGAVLVWCQEALLTESVPEARMTARWILRRSFRTGQGFADLVGRPDGLGPRLAWFAQRLAKVLTASLLAALAVPLGRATVIYFARKAASNIGQASTVLRYRLQEYEKSPS